MNAMPARWGAALRERARETDWGGVAVWALGFGLVVYLGLEGGGFDPLVHDPVGIAVWWALLAGVLVGALPRRRLGSFAWGALGLLVAFVVWTALSLSWTESTDKTAAELARVAGYLGVFALVLFAHGRKGARRMVAGVGAGIALVALVALLSRLQPGWFPTADQTADFLAGSRERLSYPVNYWNALAALIAVGAPLVLQVATCAKSLFSRALAAAALPMMALTAFFTLSRGGVAAGFVALIVFLAFSSDRLPKFLTVLVAGGGGTVLIAAAAQREALREGLAGPLAQQQGDDLFAIVLAVCLAVGLAQVALSVAFDRKRRPRWTFVSRRQSMFATGLGVVALLVVALSFEAPGRASNGWEEFKYGGSPGSGAQRLGSVAGQGRYQLWASAVDQNATKPLSGTGAGTFEYWWARKGNTGGTIRDAHSLYLQTLGELGIVGLALLVAFLLAILIGGGRETLRAARRGRPQLAAALAGCVAFCLTVAFDWHWQIPALPVAFLLLASVLAGVGARPAPREGEDGGRGGLPAALPLRLGFAFPAIAAVVAIAMPLATASLLRQSETEAREGDLRGALEAAHSAQNVQPGAATPRLQQALVLEEMDRLPAAARAAQAATEREATNWRPWLVLSRIEAERGRAAPAVRAYRKARSLNPHFSLFE
jgi:O-antigen ligase